MCEEIEYLLERGALTFHEDYPGKYFNAQLWGSVLSAPKDAVLMFYRVDQELFKTDRIFCGCKPLTMRTMRIMILDGGDYIEINLSGCI